MILSSNEMQVYPLEYDQEAVAWKVKNPNDLSKHPILSSRNPSKVIFGHQHLILHGENWNSGIQVYSKESLKYPYAIIPEQVSDTTEISLSQTCTSAGHCVENVVRMSGESTVSVYEISPLEVHIHNVSIALLQNRSEWQLTFNRIDAKDEFVPAQDMHQVKVPITIVTKTRKLGKNEEYSSLVIWLLVMIAMSILLTLVNYLYYGLKKDEIQNPLFAEAAVTN